MAKAKKTKKVEDLGYVDPKENISTKYYVPVCPHCECELKGVRKKFFHKKEIRLVETCPHCKRKIYMRKMGRYFAIGKERKKHVTKKGG